MENLAVLNVTLPIKAGLIYGSIWKRLGMAFGSGGSVRRGGPGGALALAEARRERIVPVPISRTRPGRWTVIAVPVCLLYGIFH